MLLLVQDSPYSKSENSTHKHSLHSKESGQRVPTIHLIYVQSISHITP